MKQNLEFVFTDNNNHSKPDPQFKKERAAYLAQRNARKRQAEGVLKRQRGHSTSSDDAPITPKKPTTFQQQQDNIPTQTTKRAPPPEEEDPFRAERQKYKAERLGHKRQAKKVKRLDFSQSSSDQDELMMAKRPQILLQERGERGDEVRLSQRYELDSSPFMALDMSRSIKEKSPLSVKLRVQNSIKKSSRQRYEIEVPSKKGVSLWLERYFEFKSQTIEIGQRSVPIYDITKIKLFFIKTPSGNSKMKISLKDEDLFIAVDHKKLNQLCLDHYYYFFAKIITLKLQLMGKNPNSSSRPKLALSQDQLKGAQITGKVRKSSFFGGWDESNGVINQQGLCMYKDGKEKPSLVVAYSSVRELWTRFDFNSQNLIIKFLHNNNKIELSIPFQNYLSRDNWLYHVYNLANK